MGDSLRLRRLVSPTNGNGDYRTLGAEKITPLTWTRPLVADSGAETRQTQRVCG